MFKSFKIKYIYFINVYGNHIYTVYKYENTIQVSKGSIQVDEKWELLRSKFVIIQGIRYYAVGHKWYP